MPTEDSNNQVDTTAHETSEQGEQTAASESIALTKSDLTQLLGDFKQEITGLIDTRNQGLAANFSRKFKSVSTALAGMQQESATEEPKQEKPEEERPSTPPAKEQSQDADPYTASIAALQSELQSLRTKQETEVKALREEREKERKAKFDSDMKFAISSAVAETGAQSPGTLQTVISARYGQILRQVDGKFFVVAPGGDEDEEVLTPLQTEVSTFLKTDEGKIFVRPSGVTGSGATETKAVKTVAPPKKPSSLEGMLDEINSGKAIFKV